MAFARLSAVRPNPERRRFPPADASAPSPTLDRPLDADELLHVQQTAGNVAAVELVQRQTALGGWGGRIEGEIERMPSRSGGSESAAAAD